METRISSLEQSIPLRNRLSVSVAIGFATGAFCWFLLRHLQIGAADFTWAIQAARALVNHQDPYADPYQFYPLPVALFGLPLLSFSPEVGAGIFYGSSSALLAFGLTKYGYRRLLIFLAYPYWAGMITAQWAPLIMAGAFLPLLLAAGLAKPQLGLPVLTTRWSRPGVLACATVLLVSLVILPQWPLHWIANARHYQRFIPLFVIPGPMIFLAWLRRRDRDTRLLFLMALMPQRWFYDAFILWLIPKTKRELVWTVSASWGAGMWRWYHFPRSVEQVGRWAVLFLYLPMLWVVLSRDANSSPRKVSV